MVISLGSFRLPMSDCTRQLEVAVTFSVPRAAFESTTGSHVAVMDRRKRAKKVHACLVEFSHAERLVEKFNGLGCLTEFE